MLKKSMSAVMACALLSCLFAAESKPVMRVAVISDTHVKETPQSAFLVGEAYKLFRFSCFVRDYCGLETRSGLISDLKPYIISGIILINWSSWCAC